MPGRSEDIARRNRNIKRRYDRGETPAKLAARYGISRQQVHVIVADPRSGEVTERKPQQIVRPLEKLPKSYDGITHGSEAGYRAELARGLDTCDDCQVAHAITVKKYRDRVRR